MLEGFLLRVWVYLIVPPQEIPDNASVGLDLVPTEIATSTGIDAAAIGGLQESPRIRRSSI